MQGSLLVSEELPVKSDRFVFLKLRSNPQELAQLGSEAATSYRPFDLYQGVKNGLEKWRHIDNPYGRLKEIQSRLYSQFLLPLAPQLPLFLIGGVKGRSIVDNASPHVRSEAVLSLDLKNCFPSIKPTIIFGVWQGKLGFNPHIAAKLTQVTTYHFKLPQGAPTSPILCNLALYDMASEIDAYARHSGLNFTLYIDDITISGGKKSVLKAINPVIELVQKYGYTINGNKKRTTYKSRQQVSTGLVINEKVSVSRERLESIGHEIRQIALKRHTATKQEINSVRGKIAQVQAVDAKHGTKLELLANKLIVDIVGADTFQRQDKIVWCIRKANCLALK